MCSYGFFFYISKMISFFMQWNSTDVNWSNCFIFEQICTLPCAKFRFIFKNCFAAFYSACLLVCVPVLHYIGLCAASQKCCYCCSLFFRIVGFSSPSGVQLCVPLHGERHQGISPSQESVRACARERERVFSDNTSTLQSIPVVWGQRELCDAPGHVQSNETTRLLNQDWCYSFR